MVMVMSGYKLATIEEEKKKKKKTQTKKLPKVLLLEE